MRHRYPALSVALLCWFLALEASVTTTFAQPVIVPDRKIMRLDELGVYQVGFAYRGKPEQHFPLGWAGSSDDVTGVAFTPTASENGRRSFLMHVPWRGGTGITFQQFAFRVPAEATSVLLRGATTMRASDGPRSDGVTFRVLVNGARLLDHHQTNTAWRDFVFDLTPHRGSNVMVRFEVDPGPNNNASFDFSLWGERELVLDGFAPTLNVFPTPVPLALSNVLSARTGDLAPRNAFGGTEQFELAGDVARFRYNGVDGVMEYEWRRPQSVSDGLFGDLLLRARITNGPAVALPLADSAALSWTEPAIALTSSWQRTSNRITLIRTFSVGATTATVRVSGRLTGKALSLTTTCDVPMVQRFDGAVWGPAVHRQKVPTPFYGGEVFFFEQENLFASVFLDWTVSNASAHSGTRATYSALTDGTRVPLRERIVFAPGWHFAEVLPNLPAPVSPYRGFLANRIIIDIWGGTFANITTNLLQLADYGLTNCVAIVHNWQRSGYDNALPAHFPANPKLGGDEAMRQLVRTGNEIGIPVALHENYVDYYPNYEGFDNNDIALESSGKVTKAWFNEGTKIQSFAVKPNAILRLAASQSPEIHGRYSTRAVFLDVHSAVPPWFHVDFRAGEKGAGKLAHVWNVHRELWDYERRIHNGPVFGEGHRHWYWSGYLDGAEAQFGEGWPENAGMTALLNVDFNLLKVHPLQLNHGMGYLERWWPKDHTTNWAGPAPSVVLDQYRMQEVTFGHAGFLGAAIYQHLPLAWLEHNLLSPVGARHAVSDPVEMTYEAQGRWLDTTAAMKPSSGATNNRVRIVYNNGLTITANGSAQPLQAGEWQLPEFGWIAVGAGVTGGTVLRSNVVVDLCDTGDLIFVNARAAKDWNLGRVRRVRPGVEEFKQTAPRTFRATYAWVAEEILGKDYRALVHFTTKRNEIAWQQDHAVSIPPTQWKAGSTVEDGPWEIKISRSVPDGDYGWAIGLYDPATGSRQRLRGLDDGDSRICLGTIHVRESGTVISFTAETNAPALDPSAWYVQHLNTSNLVIDFGDIRTDGSVRVRREGDQWVAQTWPRARNFILEFNADRFGPPTMVQAAGSSTNALTPERNGGWWRLPLNGSREYRWQQTRAIAR